MLPNFIVIGTMKGGTTSLFEYLRQHPEIGMSAMKELNYFVTERNFPRGHDWYASQFSGDARIFGEASPNYSKFPTFAGVPKRMHELIPDAKLIYILRDPIERIVSHYTHNVITGHENRPITAALKGISGEHYVACSRYYLQIEQYRQYFRDDAFLILTIDELTQRPMDTMGRVLQFLGVDEEVARRIDYRVHWETSSRRRLNRLGRYLTVVQQTLPMALSAPAPIAGLAARVTHRPVAKPILSPGLEASLISALQPDVDRLREYTGESYSSWRL